MTCDYSMLRDDDIPAEEIPSYIGTVCKGVSLKEMCDFIAKLKYLTKKDGTHPTADEIYRYSPHGELTRVYFWYEESLRYSRVIDESLDKTIETFKSNLGIDVFDGKDDK